MDGLVESIKDRNVILFVGAGVSASLGLPTWKELVEHMANELGYDPEVFFSLGDNLSLAEYYKTKKKTIGHLRSWMDRVWHSENIDIGKSKIHKLIVEMNFPIIYTTNYDRWLEMAFDYYNAKYKKIVNVSDMRDIPSDYTQIIKFHGDFDDDESIIIAESDYFNRLDFESPLDIKFRADALGKSILFVGYSLRDPNVRLLLYKLWKAWARSGDAQQRPGSYVFLSRPNAVDEAVLSQWGITAVTGSVDDSEGGLLKFLERLHSRVKGEPE